MDIQDVFAGLTLLLHWDNFLFLVAGVTGGIIVGALPGMGSVLLCALILPFTFRMRPDSAMMLLVAVYCGSVYAGSIGAILFNIPGTASATATALDGYPMAEKGRGGDALIADILSSGVGGVIGWVGLFFFAALLARWTLAFGPAEYAMLGLFGLTIIGMLAGKDPAKGIIAGCVGFLLAMIGMCPTLAFVRYNFGLMELEDGINMVWAVIGLFAFAQAIILLAQAEKPISRIGKVDWPVLKVWKHMMTRKMLIFRSSIIGLFIGAVPGTGASVAAWVAYNEGKRFSKEKKSFGEGNIDGVIAPEAANNAAVGGALIPMLALGLPGSATTAVILGGMMIAGLAPGHRLFLENGPIAYSILFGTLVSNLLFVVIGLVILKYVIRVLVVPVKLLVPGVVILATVGAYGIRFSMFGVFVAFTLGILAYGMRKFDFPVAPILIGLILGGIVESNFLRMLLISKDDYTVFFTRPFSLVLILMSVLSIVTTVALRIREQKLDEAQEGALAQK